MAYLYDLPNISSGADLFLVNLATELPILPVLILIAVWIFVSLGGGLVQWKRTGYIDFPMWSTLAFLTCDLLAFLLSLQSGIINSVVFSVCIAGTFFSALWLFLSRGRFDV